MDNILKVAINPDIELDENRVKDMPYNLKQHLLITITVAMDRYDCDWRDLTWSVKLYDNQPVINVKRKKDVTQR